MWCPKCNAKTKVVNTQSDYKVVRYRVCLECKFSFVSLEAMKYDDIWKLNRSLSTDEASLKEQKSLLDLLL